MTTHRRTAVGRVLWRIGTVLSVCAVLAAVASLVLLAVTVAIG